MYEILIKIKKSGDTQFWLGKRIPSMNNSFLIKKSKSNISWASDEAQYNWCVVKGFDIATTNDSYKWSHAYVHASWANNLQRLILLKLAK